MFAQSQNFVEKFFTQAGHAIFHSLPDFSIVHFHAFGKISPPSASVASPAASISLFFAQPVFPAFYGEYLAIYQRFGYFSSLWDMGTGLMSHFFAQLCQDSETWTNFWSHFGIKFSK
jgi:hypothetical protein